MEKKLTPFQRFLNLLDTDRKDITYVYVYAVLNGLIYLSVPLGIQAIINLIQGGQTNSAWILLVLIVLVGLAVTGGLQILQLSLVETLQQRIFVRSSFEMAYRIPKLKWEELNKQYLPELVNRFFDTLTVQKGLSKILFDFSTAAIQIGFGLLLLAFYHPFFIAFGLVLIFLLYLIFRFTVARGVRTSLQESKYKYQVVYWLEEVARTIGVFKLNMKSKLPLDRTNQLVTKYIEARKQHFKVLVLQYANMVAFKITVAAGLLILGGVLVFEQEMTLGQFVAAEIIILLIMSSVEKLILSMETIYDVLTAIEKIGQVTDIPLEHDRGRPLEIAADQKGIPLHLENATLYSADGERRILDNISLDIKAGEKIALIGPPGAGKSTLLHLLAGLYEDFEGKLLVNDAPIRNIQISSMRDYVGYNFAEEQIFNGSIFENVIAGRDSISTSYCRHSIEIAGLSEYIRNLEYGWDTEVGPEGKNLSGGIRSKVVLARALVHLPKLLLFEDSLQNLRASERENIYEFITRDDADWTLVASSNHRGFLERCDYVVVMKEGRIILKGTYDEIKDNPELQILLDA